MYVEGGSSPIGNLPRFGIASAQTNTLFSRSSSELPEPQRDVTGNWVGKEGASW